MYVFDRSTMFITQSGITSGFLECGFPAYFCHSKHVFFENTKIAGRKFEIKVVLYGKHV